MALVTSTGHSDGDVMTRQADGSADWEAIPGGGATAVTAAAILAAGTIIVGDDGARGVKDSTPSITGNTVTAGILDAAELGNPTGAGDLKIMPDVEGEVIMFGDTDVDNAAHGMALQVTRKAAEGDESLRFYISSTQNAIIASTNTLNLTAGGGGWAQITSTSDIFLDTGTDVYLDLGDTLGANEVKIRDSADVEVWTADTHGNVVQSGTVLMKEVAAALADVTAYGQVWVKNDAPNTLWFTDDLGNDVQLGLGSGGATAVTAAAVFDDNALIRADGTGRGVQKSGWLLADTDVLSAGGELDVGAFAINSSSGDVVFECGGTEVMRCETTNNTLLVGPIVSGNANWRVEVQRTGGSCYGMLETISDTPNHQSGLIFRNKAATSPFNVSAGERIGGFFWHAFASGSYKSLASIRGEMEGSGTIALAFSAGENTEYMRLLNGGDFQFLTSGVRVEIGSSTTWIEHDATNGLEFEVPTGKSHLWYANAVLCGQLSASILTLGPSGGHRLLLDFSTAGACDFKAADNNLAFSIDSGPNLGFFGVDAVGRPTALTTALTQITHVGPTTPDYDIQQMPDSTAGCFGFQNRAEGETVLSVILNLQERVDELETKLQALGLLT